MITYIKNPPSASSLLESMRDIGYSLETALADLVDNSISADARIVEIYCIPSEEVPYVAIIDDGYGMCKRDLLLAMQHGGVSTKSDRDRKSTRLNSSHVRISYAVFCLKKKKKKISN